LITGYFGNDSYKFTIEQALNTPNPRTNKPFLVNYTYHPCFVPLTDEELEEYKNLTEKITRMNNCKDKEEYADTLEFLLFRRAEIEKEAENKYAELDRVLDEMQVECTRTGEELRDTIIFVSDGQMGRVLQSLKKRNISAHKFTQAEGTEPSEKYGGVSEREHLIRQFARGKYQVLVAIKCLDEGIDIPSAKTGIIMASSTNPREYVQRIGRIIRQAPGKSSAVLYDMILHPDLSGFRNETLAAFEEKVFRKEMVRVKDLCRNALNNTIVLREIYSVLDDLNR
jgi:superfamily II DNA or RNA helicase